MKNIRMKMIGAAMFCLLFIIGCGGGGGGGGSQTVIAEPGIRLTESSLYDLRRCCSEKQCGKAIYDNQYWQQESAELTSFSSSNAQFTVFPSVTDCSGNQSLAKGQAARLLLVSLQRAMAANRKHFHRR